MNLLTFLASVESTLTIGQIISQYGYIPALIGVIACGIWIGKMIEKMSTITKTLDAILEKLDSDFMTKSEVELLVAKEIEENRKQLSSEIETEIRKCQKTRRD